MSTDDLTPSRKLRATASDHASSAKEAMLEQDGRQNRLQLLPIADHGKWDEFVVSVGGGTIYHTSWWHRAWGMEPTIRALLNSQGELEAGVCYCVGRRFGSKAIVRPPNTTSNGPLFRKTGKAARASNYTHAKQMLQHVIGGLPKLGIYDFCLSPSQIDVMPFLWNGFDVELRYTYLFPTAEKDNWLENANTSQRRRLRKAIEVGLEEGYTVDEAPPFDDVLPLIREAAELKRYRFKDTANRLPLWWDALSKKNALRALLVRDSTGRPACVDVMVFDNRCAYHSLTGIRNDLRGGSHIHSYLVARMIDEAHQMGLDFDFSGSVLPGVEGFKRSFGGVLIPCYRVLKFPSPIAYMVWHGHRYWTKHRKRSWVCHD